ncbi:MAG TPA: S41 family peptidase [Bryobacteraceae bacterium]|nr:S41 family peptidase [Bryobacteraceae bacterium]
MLLSLLPALALLLAPPQEKPDVETELKRFIDVYAIVERRAADPVPPEKAMYEGAIPGMLRRLDPHSVFFDPQQFDQLKELERSTRKGFGSVVSVLPGRVIVLQALPGTPAAKSGISAGDEIIGINGYALAMLELDQLIQLLTQSRQQQARLDVRRPGRAGILQFILTPEEMQAPSVERAFLVRPGVAYLRVTSFDVETGKQVRDAIEKLGGTKLNGLLLDLRNNPGGIMGAALETASLFLQPKQTLVTVRGRATAPKSEVVPDSAVPYKFPVAVLVNGKSASAAEIVAGALQDHDRAVILGEPTFGKGLVESVYPLSENTAVALTTSYYYTPSGRSIQRPLQTGQIQQQDIAGRGGEPREYRTASGRNVRGGGGIQPDREVYPDALSRFRIVMEASGVFPQFAIEYARRNPGITEDFEVTGPVLDTFQVYLSERNIRPSLAEWLRERPWVSTRLKTEIFNQAFGVERGDEIEAQTDPVIVAALGALGAKLTAAK